MQKLSVKEKHIHVTHGLQRQGAYKKDKQYPQSIDLALNLAQEQIVKARLVPVKDYAGRESDKFELNQKYASDINVLLKNEVLLDTFKRTDIENRSYGMLPYDFSYLLSDKSYVTEDCKATFKTPTETKTERVISIPFTNNTTTPYFLAITVGVGSQNQQINTVGFATIDERVYVVDLVLAAFKTLGVTAYWEDYKNIHKDKCFLVVTQNLLLPANIIVDGVNSLGVNIDTTETVFKTTLIEGVLALNRDVKADFADSAEFSIYHKPIPTSPISVLQENRILVYSSERFLVSKIYASYVRKPRRICLALNQGSELSGSVHSEICDLAIAIIKKWIQDGSYPIDTEDVSKRIVNN